MRNYNDGDTVIITGDKAKTFHKFIKGSIGRVTQVSASSCYVKVNSKEWWVSKKDLTHYNPKSLEQQKDKNDPLGVHIAAILQFLNEKLNEKGDLEAKAPYIKMSCVAMNLNSQYTRLGKK